MEKLTDTRGTSDPFSTYYPAHVFSLVILIDSKLFALSNVFPVGNMLDV